MSSKPQGKPPLEPSTSWGRYIHDRLRVLDINRQILATRLGVSPATVTRLLNRRVAAKTINVSVLCEILQLRGDARDLFLNLLKDGLIPSRAGHAGRATQASAGAGPVTGDARDSWRPHGAGLTILRSAGPGFDSHYATMELCALALNGHQDPATLLRTFQRSHSAIEAASESGWIRATDPALLEIRMRSGMLLAALQEMTLGWWSARPSIADNAYGIIAEDVVPRLHPSRHADERSELLRTEALRLNLRRAVLLREGKMHSDADDLLAGMARNLRMDQIGYAPADAVLIVAYNAQRIHTLAARNLLEQWQRELKRARDAIAFAPVSHTERARLHAILDYAQGVGAKRFMWYSQNSVGIRTQRAEEAYTMLRDLRQGRFGARATHDINLYHSSVPLFYMEPELECSEIDALIWIDPRAAFEQAMALLARAQRLYPTLIGKIEQQVDLSLERLGMQEAQKLEARRAWRADHAGERLPQAR
ncbi:MAG TPA: hypothetical protein VF808_10460 [Ktedonobacterales bacterium]